LGQSQSADKFHIDEKAYYALWNKRFNERWSTSVGTRYDRSDAYGSISNPRASLIFKPLQEKLAFKLLYGTAFREPGYSELAGVPQSNPDLTPEEISTYELEVSSQYSDVLFLRVNGFYSESENLVQTVANPLSPVGASFDNAGNLKNRGINLMVEFQPWETLDLSANYAYLEAQKEGERWTAADQTARHKLNVAINWLIPEFKANVNIRSNFVAKRKAVATNNWIQDHENGYAPGYGKTNVTFTYKGIKDIEPQLVIKNVFDKDYYGLARSTASGRVDDYDWQTTTNPLALGFIPPYDPQEGRTILFRVNYTIE